MKVRWRGPLVALKLQPRMFGQSGGATPAGTRGAKKGEKGPRWRQGSTMVALKLQPFGHG